MSDEDAVLFPARDQYYLVKRDEDGTPTELIPIEPPAHLRPRADREGKR